MKNNETKGFIRGKESLKSPNYTEIISKEEFEFRVNEIKKCREDISYFANNYYWIIVPGIGKKIIELHHKQEQLIHAFVENSKTITLASRQVGKTTAFNIFVLWTMLFFSEKEFLICANKAKSSYEIIARIKLSYELLPNWMKPGINIWNVTRIQFSNLSGVSGSATSPDAGRSQSVYCLIIDEAAFIPQNIMNEFIASVFPVVSAAKDSKIIAVSTPNGIGNFFYETYQKAILNASEDGWKPFRIDWWEVPGRDEKWKLKQLSSFNHDLRRFSQEYGNEFLGSSMTLIESSTLEKYKNKIENSKIQPIEETVCKELDYKVRFWEKPVKDHSYVFGVDVGEGVGGDFSTIIILDVTDFKKIKQVASFSHNLIPTTHFAYLLIKLSELYFSPYMIIERNGVGKSVIDILSQVFFYENLVSHSGKRGRVDLGVYSNYQLKLQACLWAKELIEMNGVEIEINDGYLVNELTFFERKDSSGKTLFSASGTNHDDFAMAFIWALFVLHKDLVENYFEVTSWFKNSLGMEMPSKLRSYASTYFNPNEKQIENNSDRIFKSMNEKGYVEPKEIDEEYSKLGYFGNDMNDMNDEVGNWLIK